MTKEVKTLIVGIAVLLSVRVTHAQLAETYSLPRPANCCLLNTAATLAEQLQDWNQLGRYHEANQELMKRPPEPERVVFLGDSITDATASRKLSPASRMSTAASAARPRRRCSCGSIRTSSRSSRRP